MNSPETAHPVPEVRVQLEVHPAFRDHLSADGPLAQAVCRNVAEGGAEILAALGIPGQPAARVDFLPSEATAVFLRVIANGQVCRCPAEVLARVDSYVRGEPLNLATPAHLLDAWRYAARTGKSAAFVEENRQLLIEFLTLASLEAIKEQPSVLLGAAQADRYCRALPQPPAPDGLHPVLRQVLDLRLSLEDRDRVAEVIGKGLAEGRAQADMAEDLIAALRPDVVEILLPRDYLRQITTSTTNEDDFEAFILLRDGLFYELGVTFPKLRFVESGRLKPNSFACKINHLTTLPRTGLKAGQYLVNQTCDALQKLGIPAQATVNPYNWGQISVAHLDDLNAAQIDAPWTWTPMAYIVLCLAVELRYHSACFLDSRVVGGQLQDLERVFPALTQAARSKATEEQLTRVMRELIDEQISIRDLRLILERWLDFDTIVVTEPYEVIVFDDRLATSAPPDPAWLGDPATLAAFVRSGMKRSISHKYAAGGGALNVLLLDPGFERWFIERRRQGIRPDEAARDRILAAIREELGVGPPPLNLHAILTTQELRAPLREIIAAEFPRLPVLAYQELTPDLIVLPMARIRPEF